MTSPDAVVVKTSPLAAKKIMSLFTLRKSLTIATSQFLTLKASSSQAQLSIGNVTDKPEKSNASSPAPHLQGGCKPHAHVSSRKDHQDHR